MDIVVKEQGRLEDLVPTPASANDAIDLALQRFAAAFVQAAQVFSPFRTGQLEQSISADITADGILIQATAPYAAYVLGGVRAGYMTGLIGHVVSFTARDGSRVTRRVTRVGEWNGRRHWYSPGQTPNDFFRRAWEDRVVQSYRDDLAALGVTLGVAFLYETPAA
ncbi:MAG TPA: hypothetical protein VGP33_14435 [Chloroflexota bacterium]|nr:hypothetical protein [Chloroflexota bacterium]